MVAEGGTQLAQVFVAFDGVGRIVLRPHPTVRALISDEYFGYRLFSLTNHLKIQGITSITFTYCVIGLYYHWLINK